ncbi:hypothetical protein MESS2_p90052 [Mesorhizobium metallidurans STM 2683]|uniref:Uncharacterized protein n=1 Tax=Mesorhizobium metallidurans STM 2683 TaxID=1297569 RepID=M5EZY6_9HYPH|nr:hypothetical protein MESS2_p90052 [Mesorhizobium metallidurans STM 2683]
MHEFQSCHLCDFFLRTADGASGKKWEGQHLVRWLLHERHRAIAPTTASLFGDFRAAIQKNSESHAV